MKIGCFKGVKWCIFDDFGYIFRGVEVDLLAILQGFNDINYDNGSSILKKFLSAMMCYALYWESLSQSTCKYTPHLYALKPPILAYYNYIIIIRYLWKQM